MVDKKMPNEKPAAVRAKAFLGKFLFCIERGPSLKIVRHIKTTQPECPRCPAQHQRQRRKPVKQPSAKSFHSSHELRKRYGRKRYADAASFDDSDRPHRHQTRSIPDDF